MEVTKIQAKLRKFAADRNWEQFHSPKNLAMALSGEVGELTELFQWLTEEQSRQLADNPKQISKVHEEIADVAIYLLRLCDQLKVPLEKVIEEKIAANALKYPPELAKGNALKYTEFKK